MDISSFMISLLGSMPRSKELLGAKRKLIKGTIDASTYEELLDAETKYIVELQEKMISISLPTENCVVIIMYPSSQNVYMGLP